MTPRQYRDSIIWRVIAKDDDSFYTFVREVRSDRALMNMSADGAVIFLNGLAAVTGTAGEKAALAVLSGGVLAGKGSVDRQLFNQETMTALLARMKAARLAALVPIKRGLTLSADAYPLEQALVDMRGYAAAGSLLATIEAITTDAGRTAEKAENEIEVEARGVAFIDSLDQRDAVSKRVVALKGKQLTFLAIRMDGSIASAPEVVRQRLDRFDSLNYRYTDPDIALGYLTRWLADDAGAGGSEWQEAVTAAEKVTP
ncbi:hypothetical protein [Sphingomonas adhaesiva]|uniref:hypothetical protein n=1 Tax=Sphingomonas adhaesiva TaxID=28212 RepID=UPI002FF756E8